MKRKAQMRSVFYVKIPKVVFGGNYVPSYEDFKKQCLRGIRDHWLNLLPELQKDHNEAEFRREGISRIN
jgi:hypothetical protein